MEESVRKNSQNPIVSELADDREVQELVEMFVNELPNRIRAIQQRLDEQDLTGLARLTHQLKGSAGGYGFPTITDKAAAIEREVHNHSTIESIAAQIGELADMCGRARAAPDQ